MKLSGALVRLTLLLATGPLNAALLPVLRLDAPTLQAFESYVTRFEKESVTPYLESGRTAIDATDCCARNSSFKAGKPVLQARQNGDIAAGSIHHFAGMLHIDRATADDVRHVMQDFSNHWKYFKPDLIKSSGTKLPDSTATDEHFSSQLTISESTLWFGLLYECAYDNHYRILDQNRWYSKSTATEVREMRDAKDPSKGFFPAGEDHGFVWKTNTYWFVRQAGQGVEIEVHSLTLSRPNIPGFGWFGTKRSRDAVDKMLRDTKTVVNSLH